MGRALARRVVLVAVAAGLVAMHQLAGGPAAHTRPAPAAHAALVAPGHCPHAEGDDCPDPSHSHPGQVCQPHQGSNGPDGIPALAVAPAPPVEPPLLSARTAASEAGDGSGRGPPGLAELSLLRV
ncbi:DUF6153 family protein [Phytohabitans sp. LJ34]|uniref:DUF6153 family protein n=1 Tax=Phytohabitans sp. LJ34 TaxID=3452217 RepID=UPI003F8A1A39